MINSIKINGKFNDHFYWFWWWHSRQCSMLFNIHSSIVEKERMKTKYNIIQQNRTCIYSFQQVNKYHITKFIIKGKKKKKYCVIINDAKGEKKDKRIKNRENKDDRVIFMYAY